MKYYKDNQNNVFAYEIDGSQDHLIIDKTPITKEEADTLIDQTNKNYIAQSIPLSPMEKLEALGLSIDELKALLG